MPGGLRRLKKKGGVGFTDVRSKDRTGAVGLTALIVLCDSDVMIKEECILFDRFLSPGRRDERSAVPMEMPAHAFARAACIRVDLCLTLNFHIFEKYGEID